MKNNYATDYIYVMRWIATLAVIFVHVFTGVYHVIPEQLTTIQLTEYKIGHMIFMFCVPFFVMITGVLFLNKDKEITIKKLICKYEKRIILALLLFGYFYCLIELFYESKKISAAMFLYSFINLIEGKTWAHMWYLYMLIGLYLLIPVIKIFINNTSDNILCYFVAVLFIFTSFIPYVNQIFNIHFGVTIPVSTCYILYLILGYMLHEEKIKISMKISVIGIICSLILFIISIFTNEEMIEYENPVVVIYSVCLFNIIKHFKYKGKLFMVIKKSNYLCFGVYLIHNLFVNMLYKFFNIYPHDCAFILGAVVFFIIYAVISITASFILNRIPILRRYVL